MTETDSASLDKDQKVLVEQVQDLRAEGDALYELLTGMDNNYWNQATSFKNWTVRDVLAHLHFSDYMALTCLRSASAFKTLAQDIAKAGALGAFTNQWIMQGREQPLTGPELLQRWRHVHRNVRTVGSGRPERTLRLVRSGHESAHVHDCPADGNLGPWLGGI